MNFFVEAERKSRLVNSTHLASEPARTLPTRTLSRQPTVRELLTPNEFLCSSNGGDIFRSVRQSRRFRKAAIMIAIILAYHLRLLVFYSVLLTARQRRFKEVNRAVDAVYDEMESCFPEGVQTAGHPYPTCLLPFSRFCQIS